MPTSSLLMDKKEIYEHLAKIYLDASKKRKTRVFEAVEVRDLLLIGFFVICIYVLLVVVNIPRIRFTNNSTPLVVQSGISTLAHNSALTNNRPLSFSFNQVNLKTFSTIEFSARKAQYQDNIFVRVEFLNSGRERSRVYVKNISDKWQDFRIYLNEFSHIDDWSKISRLSFNIESAGSQNRSGTVYITDVKLVR